MGIEQQRLGLKSKGPLRAALIKVLGNEQAYEDILVDAQRDRQHLDPAEPGTMDLFVSADITESCGVTR